MESDGEENEEQEEGDAAGQEEEEEEAEDDMELAWENLEVARKIYSKNESTHANELASEARLNLHNKGHQISIHTQNWPISTSDEYKYQHVFRRASSAMPALQINSPQKTLLTFF